MTHGTVIVALAMTRDEREHLSRIAAMLGSRLRWCRPSDDIARVVQNSGACAFIARDADVAGAPVAPLLRRVREAAPSTAIVLSVSNHTRTASTLAALREADYAVFSGPSVQAAWFNVLVHALSNR